MTEPKLLPLGTVAIKAGLTPSTARLMVAKDPARYGATKRPTKRFGSINGGGFKPSWVLPEAAAELLRADHAARAATAGERRAATRSVNAARKAKGGGR